ncbi:MAG: MFS transporter [Pseudomonadota bacterium]
MKLILSFASLFLSIFLLQLSSGGVGPLDVLSGAELGFSSAEIGILGSSHFVGFFIGCWWAPRLMGSVGHSRAFAAFTALGAIGLLSHMLLISPEAWAVMRVASGVCIAGCYTIIEAWLNAKVQNATRGRTLAIYRIVDTGGSLCGQLMIGFLTPAAYQSYILLGVICCATVLPLTLTRAMPPAMPDAPRLRPGLAWRLSPLAVTGVIAAGLTTAAFRMVGPLYGSEVGLRADQIGLFLAAFVLGGALMQFPAGWLADRYDRRWVLIGTSLAAIATSVSTATIGATGIEVVFISAMAFGAASFPIYSISAALAHDRAEDADRVELSAALMFFYALGAIVSPLAAANLIEAFGPRALFWFIAIAHGVLVLYSLYRMRQRSTATPRQPYVWIPRTSFQTGKIFRRGK